MQYKHAVLIQWSEEDQKFIATLPEWGGAHTPRQHLRRGGCHG